MTLEEALEDIRWQADASRYQNEVFLNVLVTTAAHRLGLVGFHTNHDLVDVTNKYRAMGVIQ